MSWLMALGALCLGCFVGALVHLVVSANPSLNIKALGSLISVVLGAGVLAIFTYRGTQELRTEFYTYPIGLLVGYSWVALMVNLDVPLFARTRLHRNGTPHVAITAPNNNSEVPLYVTVVGKVTPNNSPVQLVVKADNGVFYLPSNVPHVKGDWWTGRCHIGNPGEDIGRVYELIAIYGNPLKEKRFHSMPVGIICSTAVIVKKISD